MTIWRPPQAIRVKVLGLVWREDQLLLFEVQDDHGRIKGVRALGGSVEFGERREQALDREFREELGCGITILGPWHAFENIFVHEGAIGHEYLFAANVRLADQRVYGMERLTFAEADLVRCHAAWFSPTSLPEGLELYPSGLLPLIETGTICPPD